MSGALNPSNGVNRFHGSPATSAAAQFGGGGSGDGGNTPECNGAGGSTSSSAAAAAFLELTNAAAAAAAAADFGFSAAEFGLGSFRPSAHHPAAHHPPPAHHSTAAAAGFGVSYFGTDTFAENYASLAWEAQSAAALAAATTYHHHHHHHQGHQAAGFTSSCDFGPFGLPTPTGRLPAMAVQRFGSSSNPSSRNGPPCNGISNHHHSTQANGHQHKSKPRRRVATVAQRRAANIREGRRMFNLNSAFDKLRKKVPTFAYEKRLSRIETLRLAIMYIAFMTEVVRGNDQDVNGHENHVLGPTSYSSTHGLTEGHLWSSNHGPSPLADANHGSRSDRISHLCSRQV